MTQTRHIIDNDSSQVKLLPFSFIKRGSDNSRSINPVLTIAPGERIYGCGESFGALNKVGQKVQIMVTDPQGPETDGQYKPVPFFFSNRGYGIFMHTSAPVTADFGASYIGADRLFMADEQLDMFVFFGEPKDILNEYTNITGKSPMLPLWTFGTWMSRITYFSQEEGLDIAKKLRQHKIPILHIDNPLGFCTFESNADFVAKTEEGLRTLHQFRDDLRGYSRLLTFVSGIHLPVVLSVIRLLHRLFWAAERRNLCGNNPSLTVFKYYRLGYFLTLK